MSAYTVSQLAHNAGVSVHIVRDYLVRGLLRPVACTTGGYGVFDDAALQRLCCASWSSGGARRWPIWTRNWPPCQPSGRTRRHCRERP